MTDSQIIVALNKKASYNVFPANIFINTKRLFNCSALFQFIIKNKNNYVRLIIIKVRIFMCNIMGKHLCFYFYWLDL